MLEKKMIAISEVSIFKSKEESKIISEIISEDYIPLG